MADDPLEMNLQNALEQDPAFRQKLADVVGGSIAHITDSVAKNTEEQGKNNTQISWDSKTNQMTLIADAEYGKQIVNKLNVADGVQREYQKMLAQNQQQLAQMQQHPWANTLAQIAAGVSSQSKNPTVRGIGMAATRLNPTMGEMQKERMGMLQGQEGAIQGEMAGASQMARIGSDTKMLEYQRKLGADQQKSVSDLMRDTRLAVRPGSGQPLSYEAFRTMAESKNVPAQQIPGLYAAHAEEAKLAAAGKEADVARSKDKMTFKEGLDKELAGVRGKITGANRINAINTAFNNSVSDTAIAAKEKIHEASKAIDETFAQAKEVKVLGPQVQKDLSSASKTNAYLGSTEGMLNLPEFAEVQGPLFSYNKDAPPGEQFKLNPQASIPKAFQSADRTVVMSQISHEIPRLLGLLLNGQAGGASILRTDIGKKLVQDMGITGGIRVDQAKAILKIIRDTNNGNVAADMRAKPGANFSAIKDLLGATDPKNAYYFKDRKNSFGTPLVPFPDVDQTGGREGSKTPPAAEATKKYPWEKK